jgi:hypothetical protein
VTFFSWSHQAFRQRLIIFGGAQDVSTFYSLEPAPAKGGVLWTFGAAHARAAPSKSEPHCLPCCYHGEHIIMDVNPREGVVGIWVSRRHTRVMLKLKWDFLLGVGPHDFPLIVLHAIPINSF